MLLRNRILYAPDGGGSGQSMIPNSGQHQQQQQQDQNNNNQNDNNDQNNEDLLANMWQDEDDNSGQDQNTQNTNNQQNQNQNQNTDNQSPDQVFNDYVNSLPIDAKINPEELSQQLQAGDFSGLNNLLKETQANAIKQSLLTADKIMKKKIDAAVEQAVEKATGVNRAEHAIRQMNDKFSFTTDPAIKPVADAALNRFLSKGDSLDEAIDKVGQFARRIAEKSHKETRPANSDGRFKSNAQDLNMDFDDDNPNEPDWAGILG